MQSTTTPSVQQPSNSSFLSNVIGNVKNRLTDHQLSSHADDEAIEQRVTRLWSALCTAVDFTATTSQNAGENAMDIWIDMIIVNSLIIGHHSTDIPGLR